MKTSIPSTITVNLGNILKSKGILNGRFAHLTNISFCKALNVNAISLVTAKQIWPACAQLMRKTCARSMRRTPLLSRSRVTNKRSSAVMTYVANFVLGVLGAYFNFSDMIEALPPMKLKSYLNFDSVSLVKNLNLSGSILLHSAKRIAVGALTSFSGSNASVCVATVLRGGHPSTVSEVLDAFCKQEQHCTLVW